MTDSILLYRFLNASAALKTIERKMFRVGRVMEFNDPFEWKIGFTNYVPEGKPVARAVQETFLKGMNSKMGVICFSDTADHPVLWSQYADHHRGIALVVDHTHSETLLRVNYSHERPIIDLNRLNSPDADSYQSEVLNRMLKTKSKGWEYEREYRVVADLATCSVSDGHYFMPIPSGFLKKVILGFRCLIDEVYMRRSLDAAGFADVEVTRVRDDNETYKIHC